MMRRYIRSRVGRVFFFTVVTHERRKILTTDVGRTALRTAIRTVRAEHPFRVTAVVLLPDHLHAVWELPAGDADYPTRWRLIKSRFTRLWADLGGDEGFVGPSRSRKEERGVWQRRFYEHTCRDDEDLRRCVDYIHVNPVKHRLVGRVIDRPWSSSHRYLRLGEYSNDWGATTNGTATSSVVPSEAGSRPSLRDCAAKPRQRHGEFHVLHGRPRGSPS
jgi:putative transposase